MGNRTMGHVTIRKIALLFACFAMLMPGAAVPWGFYAHGVTGKIAMANIRPETRAGIERLLRSEAGLGTPECSVAEVEELTTWADCVRRTRWRWGYTAAWHYRTTPICEEYNPRANCSGGNCVTAQITRNHRLLADESLPDAIRLEALAFLVHFTGDIHMPLHSGDKDDRGGNDRTASYGVVPGMNLHWIWDGALAERAITSTQRPMVRRYSPAERSEIATGTPEDWGRESWMIARDFVYPTAFDQEVCGGDLPEETALSQEDIEASLEVAQMRVRQAGLRIARQLDEAFEPGPLPEEPRR